MLILQVYCWYQIKWWLYEFHTLEARNEEINAKKIIAVNDAPYAVAKRKPEKTKPWPLRYRDVALSQIEVQWGT